MSKLATLSSESLWIQSTHMFTLKSSANRHISSDYIKGNGVTHNADTLSFHVIHSHEDVHFVLENVAPQYSSMCVQIYQMNSWMINMTVC